MRSPLADMTDLPSQQSPVAEPSAVAASTWRLAALRTIGRYKPRVARIQTRMYRSYKARSRAGSIEAFIEAFDAFQQLHVAVARIHYPPSQLHLRRLVLGTIDGCGRGYTELAAAYQATDSATAGSHFQKAVQAFQAAKRDGRYARRLLNQTGSPFTWLI
jgi:hypothetical protein